MGIIDEFKTQKQQIVKDHPNPLSKERRQKLADLKQKKEKAFRETGLEEKDVIHTLNQKDIQFVSVVEPSLKAEGSVI